jgi:hypothetical protein
MIPIGADVHKGRCVFAMMTEEGKLKMLEPIECEGQGRETDGRIALREPKSRLEHYCRVYRSHAF